MPASTKRKIRARHQPTGIWRAQWLKPLPLERVGRRGPGKTFERVKVGQRKSVARHDLEPSGNVLDAPGRRVSLAEAAHLWRFSFSIGSWRFPT